MSEEEKQKIIDDLCNQGSAVTRTHIPHEEFTAKKQREITAEEKSILVYSVREFYFPEEQNAAQSGAVTLLNKLCDNGFKIVKEGE